MKIGECCEPSVKVARALRKRVSISRSGSRVRTEYRVNHDLQAYRGVFEVSVSSTPIMLPSPEHYTFPATECTTREQNESCREILSDLTSITRRNNQWILVLHAGIAHVIPLGLVFGESSGSEETYWSIVCGKVSSARMKY